MNEKEDLSPVLEHREGGYSKAVNFNFNVSAAEVKTKIVQAALDGKIPYQQAEHLVAVLGLRAT